MEVRVIKSEADHRIALGEAERLVSIDPETGSAEAERLELLTVLIEDYEKRHFPIETPDPIEAIEFRMAEQGLRQIDLAPLLGSRSRVSEILSRKRPLTVQMIRSLSAGLGIPLETLVADRPRADSRESAEGFDWEKFPVKEMEKRGWLEQFKSVSASSIEARVAAFLESVMHNAVSPALYRRNFRGDTLDDKTYFSTLAWTARVLIRAKQLEGPYGKFDPQRLDSKLFRDIAQLSVFNDGPLRAIDRLAGYGVAVIVEPKLPNTLLDGAALMTENGLPIIGMTLRYDRVDYFWFTLLHELTHIWKHLLSPEEAFIDRVENADSTLKAEKEANRIARDALIPKVIWERSLANLAPSVSNVEKLAAELHIHPAIIVGRLQRESGHYERFRHLLGQDSIRTLFPELRF